MPRFQLKIHHAFGGRAPPRPSRGTHSWIRGVLLLKAREGNVPNFVSRFGGIEAREPFCILLEQEMMGWQWHHPDHTQIICTLLQTDNHASTSPLSFYRPDALPAAQPTASKHWRHVWCTMVWRIRGKIIRTVLCCVVYDSCAQWYTHTHAREQFLKMSVGLCLFFVHLFRFSMLVFFLV